MDAMNAMFKNNPNSPFAQTPYDRELYGRKDGVNAPSVPFIWADINLLKMKYT